ncbi:MAG: hypothetical protein RBU37_15005 [Myxococcota bacterium]|nr:hypothetical protein [Myxococcota bacterium]
MKSDTEHEVGGMGQEPNRQKPGETGQEPNRQKHGGTGQEPNRQKNCDEPVESEQRQEDRMVSATAHGDRHEATQPEGNSFTVHPSRACCRARPDE